MGIVIINGRRFSSSSARVLKILEENNVDVVSECRAGYCGQCKCEVANPEAVKHSAGVIANLSQNEILPCSAYVIEGEELRMKM